MEVKQFELKFQSKFKALLDTLQPFDRLLIACSNGPDSKALLTLLRAIKPARALKLSVIHVLHNLRAEAYEEYASLEREIAALNAENNSDLQMDFIAFDADVNAYAEDARQSVEEAASNLRRCVFALCAAHYGRQGERVAVCLAQHQGDQAETLLLHLFSGSNLQGLSAIRAFRNYKISTSTLTEALSCGYIRLQATNITFDIAEIAAATSTASSSTGATFIYYTALRPLLDYTKAELVAYLDKKAQKYYYDRSNTDTRYRRNFIRREILPKLVEPFPAIQEKLATTAQQMQQVYDLQQTLLQGQFRRYFTLLSPCLPAVATYIDAQNDNDFCASGLQEPLQAERTAGVCQVTRAATAFAISEDLSSFPESQEVSAEVSDACGDGGAACELTGAMKADDKKAYLTRILLRSYWIYLCNNNFPDLQQDAAKSANVSDLMYQAAVRPTKQLKILALSKTHVFLLVERCCVILNLQNSNCRLAKSRYDRQFFTECARPFWYEYFGKKIPLRINYRHYFRMQGKPASGFTLRTAEPDDYLLQGGRKVALYDYVAKLPIPLDLYSELFVIAEKDGKHVHHLFYKNLTKDVTFTPF